MSSFLNKTFIPPEKIMAVIHTELKNRSQSWRKNAPPENIPSIEQAEQNLFEVQEMKEQILQKLWRQRRQHKSESESESLLRSLLLLEHILLPLYRERVDALKIPYRIETRLIDQAQEQFARLFGSCSEGEETRLRRLSEKLKKEIKGQDNAIKALNTAILKWRKIPPRDGKPLVLFFAGPPGVGKSETATRFAFEMNFAYGIKKSAVQTHESNVRRINLNRHQQGGLLGWDKVKSEILSHLLYEPTSVIILEEWDKMDQAEMSCLLELLDGTPNHMQLPWSVSSTNGSYVDKSCATFILTSNISTQESSSQIPFEQKREFVKQGIIQCFPHERAKDAHAFLSRIDEVIPFEPPLEQEVSDLIETYLDEYIAQKALPSDKKQDVKEFLYKKSSLPTDMRELQRIVQDAIFQALGPIV